MTSTTISSMGPMLGICGLPCSRSIESATQLHRHPDQLHRTAEPVATITQPRDSVNARSA
jgi:hypothetical protein